jgi:hypothetical protein
MRNRLLTASLCLIALSFVNRGVLLAAAGQKPAEHAAAMPDKAYLQKIWNGWATLDPAQEAQFHAPGPRTFYDESPLAYYSWAEFQAGVTKILGTIKSGTFTVNDDAQLHPAGRYVWGNATVKEDLIMSNGKRAIATLRWTVVFERLDGKWLIVHEHISAPAE